MKFLLILLLFSTRAKVFSEDLSLPPERLLKRMAYQLSGQPPSLEDQVQLANKKTFSEKQEFLRFKREEFLAQVRFSEMLDRKLSDLFFLSPTPSIFGGDAEDKGLALGKVSSLNLLFRAIAIENKPWAKLFTEKNYFVILPQDEMSILYKRDEFFFRFANPGISIPENPIFTGFDYQIQKFSKDDPRISGAFTTERFQRRYVTTELNKNRKRAAAIFRIGLCDSMKAAVTIAQDRENELFELAFDHLHQVPDGQNLEQMLEEDSHGRDPACMACHYKLDPMGRTLRGLNHSLSPVPWAGALSYTNSAGQKILIPGEGVGDVMDALVTQDDFWTCQVKRFAEWVYGKDRYLSKARLHDLKVTIRDQNLGVKDIFRYLIDQPEFSTIQVLNENQKLGLQAREIFKRCDSCHSDSTLGPPALSEWPMGGSPLVMRRWLSRIARVLDFEGEGASARMPPSFANWRLSKEEVGRLKAWVDAGSPDETGAPILGSKQ